MATHKEDGKNVAYGEMQTYLAMKGKDEVEEEGDGVWRRRRKYTRKASSWRLEADAESERKREKWVTRARRVGERHYEKGKAEERACGTHKHHISKRKGWRNKENERKNGGTSMTENEDLD